MQPWPEEKHVLILFTESGLDGHIISRWSNELGFLWWLLSWFGVHIELLLSLLPPGGRVCLRAKLSQKRVHQEMEDRYT